MITKENVKLCLDRKVNRSVGILFTVSLLYFVFVTLKSLLKEGIPLIPASFAAFMNMFMIQVLTIVI